MYVDDNCVVNIVRKEIKLDLLAEKLNSSLPSEAALHHFLIRDVYDEGGCVLNFKCRVD